MENYFRITGYYPDKNVSFIMDSYGVYEKLWQFSSALIQKGCKVIEVGSQDKFIDGNIPKINEKTSKMVLRATAEEEPIRTTYEFNGVTYKAIQVGDKIYIPDNSKI